MKNRERKPNDGRLRKIPGRIETPWTLILKQVKVLPSTALPLTGAKGLASATPYQLIGETGEKRTGETIGVSRSRTRVVPWVVQNTAGGIAE